MDSTSQSVHVFNTRMVHVVCHRRHHQSQRVLSLSIIVHVFLVLVILLDTALVSAHTSDLDTAARAAGATAEALVHPSSATIEQVRIALIEPRLETIQAVVRKISIASLKVEFEPDQQLYVAYPDGIVAPLFIGASLAHETTRAQRLRQARLHHRAIKSMHTMYSIKCGTTRLLIRALANDTYIAYPSTHQVHVSDTYRDFLTSVQFSAQEPPKAPTMQFLIVVSHTEHHDTVRYLRESDMRRCHFESLRSTVPRAYLARDAEAQQRVTLDTIQFAPHRSSQQKSASAHRSPPDSFHLVSKSNAQNSSSTVEWETSLLEIEAHRLANHGPMTAEEDDEAVRATLTKQRSRHAMPPAPAIPDSDHFVRFATVMLQTSNKVSALLRSGIKSKQIFASAVDPAINECPPQLAKVIIETLAPPVIEGLGKMVGPVLTDVFVPGNTIGKIGTVENMENFAESMTVKVVGKAMSVLDGLKSGAVEMKPYRFREMDVYGTPKDEFKFSNPEFTKYMRDVQHIRKSILAEQAQTLKSMAGASVLDASSPSSSGPESSNDGAFAAFVETETTAEAEAEAVSDLTDHDELMMQLSLDERLSLGGVPGSITEQIKIDFATKVTNNVLEDDLVESSNLLQSALSDSIRHITDRVASADLSKFLTTSLTENLTRQFLKFLLDNLSKSLLRLPTREITRLLTPALTHSLGLTLTNSLTRSPLSDYYCWYCFNKQSYCGNCQGVRSKDYFQDYYAHHYSHHYSMYFTEHYAKEIADFFVDNYEYESPFFPKESVPQPLGHGEKPFPQGRDFVDHPMMAPIVV
jgi:hypothetical protein